MRKTALITGATGFIGGKLATRLHATGWRVAVIVRPGSDPVKLKRLEGIAETHTYDGGPAQLIEIVRQVNPDVVFHLASLFLAEHTPAQVADLVGSNITFPTQLLEAMAATGVKKLINTGTSWQHYQTRSYRPVNLYAATKQSFEDILAYYADARAISYVTLKLFDTYGPGDGRRKIVNILADAAKAESVIGLSPGEQVVDFTHVEDVVDAFIHANELLDKKEGVANKAYFLSGERFTLRQLVGNVAAVMGTNVPVDFGARPYRMREVMAPVDAADEALPGWLPRRTFLKDYFND